MVKRKLPAIVTVTLVAAALMIAGCDRRTDSAQAPASQATKAPVLAVTTAHVISAPMRRTLTVLGFTVALQPVILRAPTAGVVTGINLQAGDKVRKGETVAYLYNREIQAAEQGLKIARQLDHKDAAALAKSVDRYAHPHGIPIVSPQSGIVTGPPVADGQEVSYLQPIVTLINPSDIYVQASVPLENSALIERGMHVGITSPLKPGVEMPGRVAAILPEVNTASATSQVRIDFTGPARILQAGAPVEAHVITKFVPNATVIPAVALFQNAGKGYYVFVAGSDGRAHRTPITLGIQTASRAQVTSGLHPGERVITSGGYALSDGLRISVEQESGK